MKACILAVGTELLFGQINNTNATYLSKELNNLGIDVLYHRVVGDNENRLKRTILDVLSECDLILVTGGLGPTQDDLTKETISSVFNRKLILNEDELTHLKNLFEKRKNKMVASNIKQVMMPEDCITLHNDFGTAPGFVIESKRKDIKNIDKFLVTDKQAYLNEKCILISMPGPPREMKPMFENYVKPYLNKYSSSAICYKFVKTIGIGESDLESRIETLLENQEDVTIAPYASLGEVSLRVTAKAHDYKEAEKLVDSKIDKLLNIIEPYVYSLENKNLQEVVVAELTCRGLSISSAESCTGGMFAEKLTSVSGASKVFNRGFVTYSNEAKMQDLNVSSFLIKEYGAVSSQVAEQMALGVKNKSNTDMGISVTGIAGPKSDDTNKEVGLVYIAIAYKNKVKSYRYNFNGSREDIRNRSVLMMFNTIYKMLQGAI